MGNNAPVTASLTKNVWISQKANLIDLDTIIKFAQVILGHQIKALVTHA